MQIIEPKFDEREIELVRECLASGWVTQGPMTAAFEQEIAKRHNVAKALATTSCTAALHLATLGLGLGPGDEVIVPAFTWITSANCAEYVGAKAVFADVDLETYNIDIEALEAAITPNTRAIVAVHLFGLAADMDPIMQIASKHNLFVIEDAACAVATTYKGQPIGGIGTAGCFSFHPRKIVTTGEGGMVTTNDEALAARVASFRNHGASPPPGPAMPWTMNPFNVLGFNLRLSDIQAAVGLAQLEKLDGVLNERRAIAHRYNELFADADELVLPVAGDAEGHAFQSYVVRLRDGGMEKRNKVMEALAEKDIQSRPGTHAVHRLGYYADKYGLKPQDFPNAVVCEETTITLPVFAGMTDEDQKLVCDTFQAALVNN